MTVQRAVSIAKNPAMADETERADAWATLRMEANRASANSVIRATRQEYADSIISYEQSAQ